MIMVTYPIMKELKMPLKLVRKEENARARTVRYWVNPGRQQLIFASFLFSRLSSLSDAFFVCSQDVRAERFQLTGRNPAIIEVTNEERRQQVHRATRDKQLADSLEFRLPSLFGRQDDRGTVLSPDLSSRAQAERNGCAEAHDDDKDDVGGRADRAGRVGLGVEAEVDGPTDDGSESLGSLPNGEIEAAVAGRGVADDDCCFTV
jgi:hypothetical protein